MFAAGYRGYILPEHLYKMRDDRNAIKRRTWQARKNEMYVKYIGAKMLNIPWYYYIYLLKPLIVYLMPRWLYKLVHIHNF
jgi:glycosyltransferase EpsE